MAGTQKNYTSWVTMRYFEKIQHLWTPAFAGETGFWDLLKSLLPFFPAKAGIHEQLSAGTEGFEGILNGINRVGPQ